MGGEKKKVILPGSEENPNSECMCPESIRNNKTTKTTADRAVKEMLCVFDLHHDLAQLMELFPSVIASMSNFQLFSYPGLAAVAIAEKELINHLAYFGGCILEKTTWVNKSFLSHPANISAHL